MFSDRNTLKGLLRGNLELAIAEAGLGGTQAEAELERALRAFDASCSQYDEVIEDIVNYLVSGDEYVHILFEGKQHYSIWAKEIAREGDLSVYPDLDIRDGELFFKGKGQGRAPNIMWRSKSERIELYGKHEFKRTRIRGRSIGSEASGYYVIEIAHLDDSSGVSTGCYLNHMVIIPSRKIKEVLPGIRENPELLLQVHNRVFGNKDQYAERLVLDPAPGSIQFD